MDVAAVFLAHRLGLLGPRSLEKPEDELFGLGPGFRPSSLGPRFQIPETPGLQSDEGEEERRMAKAQAKRDRRKARNLAAQGKS